MWVKICGVRDIEAARHAEACGADAIGINLHAPSVRSVSPEQAKAIQAAIQIPAYLVVVNWPQKKLSELVTYTQAAGIQFHGDTSETEAQGLGHPFLKAYAATSDCLERIQYSQQDRILLDAFVPGLAGGTGRQVDRGLVKKACLLKKIILAGGLHPENVADIIRELAIVGVDVASGIESAPGVQDPEKVARFISQAKHARDPSPE